METSALLLLSAVLFFVTLVGIAVRFKGGGVTDIIVLFTMVFGLFYGLRPLLFVLGLDTPYPDRFFDMPQAPTLAAITLLWLTAFLVCFGVGVWVTSERAPTSSSLVFSKRVPSLARLTFVTVVLTVLAAAVSVIMTAKYGGVGPFIRAVKIDKSLSGLYFLKIPAAMGTLCAVATFVQMRRSPSLVTRGSSALVLGCGLVDGFSVFVWGERSALVVMGVMLLIGTLTVRDSQVRTGTVVVSLVAAVAIVLGVSTGLRYARDDLVAGEVQSVVADASVARQISLGTNSVYFDSSMLAFRDWPSAHPFRLGTDFYNGAAGFVPRILWAGKPKQVKAGQGFRQIYQPRIVNGWPVGAPTLWWLNFGPIGVLLGGLISGLLFGALRAAQRNSAKSGLNVGIALVSTVYVFQTGVGPEWPTYFAAWLLPLLPITWFVNWKGRLDFWNFGTGDAEPRLQPSSTESAPAEAAPAPAGEPSRV